MTVQRHEGAPYMDAAFSYKEAITNAYGLIDYTKTHVASHSLLCIPEEKGHLSILYGKASVWGSSFWHTLQSNSWGSCRMEII